MKSGEVNFDGLVGPTHNYGGLAKGNPHSVQSRYRRSHPRAAALQGLAKMRLVHRLGIPQGLIPPQTRPDMGILRRLGFEGTDREILIQAAGEDFDLFLTACSASSMWVANAATVTPSVDSADAKVHLTPANLIAHPHRSYESRQTYEFLKQIFAGAAFIIHPPLAEPDERDEGAANHMRLCSSHDGPGLHIFVYGDPGSEPGSEAYPARQTLAASRRVAEMHRLTNERTVFLRQNPAVIKQGVFHNDVIAMSNEDVLIYHQDAYLDADDGLREVADKFYTLTGNRLQCIEVPRTLFRVADAVSSYFFNSQLITVDQGHMVLICPEEARGEPVRAVIKHIRSAENRITEVRYVTVRESMLNGGGPACLRLRVPLRPGEPEQMDGNYLLDDRKIDRLEDWVRRRYREELTIDDLCSVELLEESRDALEELMQMINRGFRDD